jgi:hypothetical protein
MRRFRITIGESAQTGVCGNVVYGEGVPPPPATDPDARYPSRESGYGLGAGGGPAGWGPMQGVPYTILEANTLGPSRVRFKVSVSELWQSWCALQTPISTSIGYRCAPNLPGRGGDDVCFLSHPDGHEEPIDCMKLTLCGTQDICVCNAQECVASHQPSIDVDLEFADDEAWGTMWYLNYPVALHRIQ